MRRERTKRMNLRTVRGKTRQCKIGERATKVIYHPVGHFFYSTQITDPRISLQSQPFERLFHVEQRQIPKVNAKKILCRAKILKLC